MSEEKLNNRIQIRIDLNDELKENSSVIVELDNDDNSTNTPNNFYININQVDNKITTNLNNFSHLIKQIPTGDTDYQVYCFMKINDFKEFLNDHQEYETEKFDFILPKFNVKLIGKIYLIPTENNFSVRVIFEEDFKNSSPPIETEINRQLNLEDFYVIKDEEIEVENINKIIPKYKKKNKKEEDLIYLQKYSKEIQKLMKENDLNIDINYGIYFRNKKFFSKQNKGKIKLNETNENMIENYYEYDNLLYDNLINPFIFRVKVTAPGRPPQKCSDYIGIHNEGNTCYAGSILQILYNINVIRKAVYKIPSAEETSLFSIQKIFYSLQTEKKEVKIVHLFKSFNWDKEYWNTQQDAQEFFSTIYDLIAESETMLMGDSSVISEYCEGVVDSSIFCPEIFHESKIKEKFHFLQLDIEYSFELIECIEKYFRVEMLTGDDQYEYNGRKYDAQRTFNFNKIPSILFVQLKRFKYDQTDMIKLNTFIKYPDKIDFGCYFDCKVEENYKLFAVLVHDGTISSGHYFTFIKDVKNDRWIKYNDAKVTIATEEEVFDQNFGGVEDDVQITEELEIKSFLKENQRTAYILVYIQESRIKEFMVDVTLEDIPESLMQILVPEKRSKSKLMNSYSYNNNINSYFPKNTSTYNNNNISNNNSTNIINNFNEQNNNNNTNSNLYYTNNQNKNNDAVPSLDSLNSLLNVVNGPSINKSDYKDKNSATNNSKQNNKNYLKEVLNNKSKKRKSEANLSTNKNEITIEINTYTIDTPQNSNFVNTNNYSSDPSLKKSFLNKKDLLRTFKLDFIDNKTNNKVFQVDISKQLDKKILAMTFITECYSRLDEKTFGLLDLKMVILNKLGIFIKLIDDEEEINDYLLKYAKKEIYLCFYILDDKFHFYKENRIFAFHFMKNDFLEFQDPFNIQSQNIFIPRVPFVSLDDENNIEVFKLKLNEKLSTIFKNNKKENYKIYIIENQEQTLESIDKYTSVKASKGLGSYEMEAIKQKKRNEIIRIALESSEIFYN